MSWISASDPLALVYLQSGQIPTPNSEEDAEITNSELDVAQRPAKIGEPVPIVFARRRNNAGGILISPGATEARFTNDATNAITVNYHLVLGEGQMGPIPVKDLFHGPCRIGTHSQTYNRRAGTWDPGNFIQFRPGLPFVEASYYCGIIGNYPKMSTLSFEATYPPEVEFWKRQVHIFVRDGMYVTRLADGVTGPSDSFADLVRWIHENSARVPSALIDVPALQAADTFLSVNGFTCNCNIKESQNVSDYLAKWAPYFLLKETRNGGKRGLRPLLPVTSGGAIDTNPITWKYSFTENDIVTGSFEIQYSSLTDRQPFVVQTIWRQQLESDFGITRTAEVRYGGTAPDGPFESHDLSAFCTSEQHAVKVGAYILSKRVRTTHAVRFTARPQAHNKLLSPGDIIHVQLKRQASAFAATEHDFLYQVERITRTLSGEVRYEAVHFPVDAQGRSLLALDVAAAAPTGALLPSNKTGLGCDLNSALDNTIPPETGRDGTVNDQPTNMSYATPVEPEREPIENDDGLDNVGTLTRYKFSNEDSPTILKVPSACASGAAPRKVEWLYSKSGSKTFQKLPGAAGPEMLISRLPPGSQVVGTADISTPGDRYMAVYYCSTKPFDQLAQNEKIYTQPYTVRASDLAPWDPQGPAPWAQAISYAWYRQDDGLSTPGAYLYDPTKRPYVGGSGITYHTIFTPNPNNSPIGHIIGYQNTPFNYADVPSNTSYWNIAQGPSVVGWLAVGYHFGPTSSLPSGSMATLPSGWNTYLVNNGNVPTYYY